MMTSHEEQELFLKYLRDIYTQNPTLAISKHTIYKELFSFYTINKSQYRLGEKISLINVQKELSDEYGKKFSKNGYFWLYENRNGLSDTEFYNKICGGIKLYIAVDQQNIKEIANSIIGFLQKEKIITQSKVAKIMRNDALVVRVSTVEEANKVIDYANGLNNSHVVRPNPFTYKIGKVSVTRDGNLSYNMTLSELLEEYLINCRNNGKLNEVSTEKFLLFIKEKIKELSYNNDSKNDNYLMILNIIAKNLDGTITKEYIFNLPKTNGQNEIYDELEKDKLRYIISLLSNYYDVDTYHEILEKYISTGNINYFTRKDGIRAMVYSNFSPSKMNTLLNEMGQQALYFAVKVTSNKYGNDQIGYAIRELLLNSSCEGFTNDSEARSSLLSFVTEDRLKRIIQKETFPLYTQFFVDFDKLTFSQKQAIYTSNYDNYTPEEIIQLKNIEIVLNRFCLAAQESLLQRTNQHSKIH